MGYVSNNETLRKGDNFGYGRQWRRSDSATPAAGSSGYSVLRRENATTTRPRTMISSTKTSSRSAAS